MEPPTIQYADAADGVSIAYYAMGEGPALVLMAPLQFRHTLRQWELEPSPDRQVAQFLLGRGRRLVQFDPRGMGSSSPVEELTLDGLVLDLEAVVDHLELETFDLVATGYSCPVAIAYAARHPERVAHLAVGEPFVRGAEALTTETGRAVRALRDQDWDVYVDTVNHIVERGNKAGAERSAALMREGGPKVLGKIFALVDEIDLGSMLPKVEAPTLVVALATPALISTNQSREVASRIPDAQLVISDEPFMLLAGHFLGLLDDSAPAGERVAPSSTVVILFADIADSTGLTERLGDAAFREKARDLDEALRQVIDRNGGRAIEGKLLGDGVLATFRSAAQAIEAALRCRRSGEDAGLPLHLGLHAGDVIREEDPGGRANVYGGAVIIAARISDATAPGELLVSDIVRGLARTSTGVTFEDRGEHQLKGVSEAVRLYMVH